MTEPIAIVGMGCRFPGDVTSPSVFWQSLVDGMDAIGEVPPDRWDHYLSGGAEQAAAVRKTSGLGGFVSNVDDFDAGFFRITPREAALMDPQQRMALEVSWEALEHGGIVPSSLAGGDAGVFLGVNTDDHGRRMLEDLPRIEAWTGIGSSLCAVANRVSYVLDLHGPSMVVDTACSSSLVAIHLAAQSLRSGETSVALAGGVMLMIAPGLTMVMDSAGALAPDGRSKSFSAAADGYGRGEGCGVVVLKRLSDAQRDGDRVLAVLRGSAVHQDGRTNGIMAPSRTAQEDMLRLACTRAGVAPESVDYVEAHGTGTRAGDPIEAGALAAVYGAGRPADRPCLIGSVKTNIGHLEAASGIAGVIKAVLAIEHAAIPPSLNFDHPNPEIPWSAAGLRVVTALTPWPSTGGPRRASVSGYGYGGTIAHLVLEQAPLAEQPTAGTDRGTALRVYPLSGNSPAAARDYAGTLASWLGSTDIDLADLAYTLTRRREHLAWRTSVVAAGRTDLIAKLRQVDDEGSKPLRGAANGVVWVFSGHGSQWIGMGRELLATEPAFGRVLDELEPICVAELGVSPRKALLEGDLLHTDRIQLLIFATQVALAEVWLARGLRPAAVLGHSVGEIAAAVVAGILTRADGARLICRRSSLLRRVAGKGAMAMVSLPWSEAEARLAGYDGVCAAIDAGPRSTVIAGDAAELEVVVKQWSADPTLVIQRVNSDVAFHSHHMDALAPDLASAVSTLASSEPSLRVYSTSLLDPRGTDTRDGAYWAGNLRNPVRFRPAVLAAVADGYRAFLEVSPHPVVTYSLGEILAAEGIEDAVVAHTLRRNRPEQATLLANLGTLHCHGAPVDWSVSYPTGRLAELPVIAWQHKPYRVPPRAGDVHTRLHDVDSHTLLGSSLVVHGTSEVRVWQTWLDRESRPYPGDHPVQGTEIIPAAVLLNTFLAAADGHVLTDVSLRVPVSVATARELQVVHMDGRLRLCSRRPDDEWLTHTTAAVPVVAEVPGTPVLPLAEIRDRCTERLDPNYVTDRLASIGVAAMGFPWTVERIRRGRDELFLRVVANPSRTWASLTDAALSAASVVFSGPATLRMPAHIRQYTVAGRPPAEAVISARVQPGSTDTVDVWIATPDGEVVATLFGLRYGVLEGDDGAPASPHRLVHEIVWRPYELPKHPVDLPRVIFVGDRDLATDLAPLFTEAGVDWETADEIPELTGAATVLVAPPPGEPVAAASLLVRTAQALVGRPVTLWCLTRGAREGKALADAGLWGLGRVIGGEHPELWGGIVDLDPRDPSGAAGLLRRLIAARPGEDVISIRDAKLQVARLAPVDGTPTRPPLTCRPDGTYLITGGLGVLGLAVAEWLAGKGARRLVLAGRHALPPRREWDDHSDPRIDAVRALEAAGVTVQTIALDIGDIAQAQQLKDLGLPPIRGIVHAAGVVDNRLLSEVDETTLENTLRPKVAGALVLDELFPPGSLDFFVLFSSAGQLLGLPGQAAYAAANAVLDAFARTRQDTTSFAWTSWRGLGMSTSSAVIDVELNSRGTADITAAEAFRAWDHAHRHHRRNFAVLRVIPGRRPPLLRELANEEPLRQDTATPWLELPPDELRDYLRTEVTAEVAAELKLATDELDTRRPLIEMGLDSVMTQIIRGRLERRFRVSLPATLLWNQPTVAAISEFLAELLTPADTGAGQDELGPMPPPAVAA
jgi:6-methylsalicylic acid synthase